MLPRRSLHPTAHAGRFKVKDRKNEKIVYPLFRHVSEEELRKGKAERAKKVVAPETEAIMSTDRN